MAALFQSVQGHIKTSCTGIRKLLLQCVLLMCVCVDRYVILGGHRDAWVFGGIDPMSGAAVMHEAARGAGKLLSKGKVRFISFLSPPLLPVSPLTAKAKRLRNNLVCVCVCVGWRPRRTIIFASWDAEEFGLLGSTEWAEVP